MFHNIFKYVVLQRRQTMLLWSKWLATANVCLQKITQWLVYNIEITHVFSCINICRVPRKLFEHETVRQSVQTSSEGPGKC